MTQLKKNIARLVLQGASVLGILLGFYLFLGVIYMIFSIQRDNLSDLCFSLIISVWILFLAAFLIYPSYLTLRGKSFAVIKAFSAFLALISISLVMRFLLFVSATLGIEEKSPAIKSIVFLAFLSVSYFVAWLVYTICVKLLERLKQTAYGPEKISDIKAPVQAEKMND